MSRSLTHGQAVVAAVFVTVLWSSSWVLIRFGLDEEALEPITFAALRYSLAAVVLAVWTIRRSELRRQITALDRSSWHRLVILGLTFYTVTQGAQFVAIDHQPAATTSLILSWTPLLVAVLAGRAIGEAPSIRQILGTVTVALGAVLYFAGDLGASAVGLAAALVGLGANAASSILGRGVNRSAEISPLVVTSISMAIGAAALLVIGLATEGVPILSGRAWLVIVWLAAVNTALAFTLWNLSLRAIAALESAAINNTMLVQIALLGWAFLDEAPSPIEWLGIAAVTAGVLLSQQVSTRTRGMGSRR